MKLNIRSSQTAKGGINSSGMRISQAGSISLDSKNPTATNKRTIAIPVLVSIEFSVLVSWFNLLITIRQTLHRAPFFDLYDQLFYH